ncbi:MAG: SGNH/GDSL hydrolase family protein [Ruminiclostridium sp.]|nr:SGNH/GDSL hydrolase family protein [Ruminiclostridium sp.]
MKKDYCKEPFKYMVAIGDSITMGASATKREYCWVYRLAELISEFQENEIEFFNAGIGGNLISRRSYAYNDKDSGKPSGLERFRRDVICRKPDLIVISYGLNDLRCGTPIDIFLEDFDIMVKEIQKETKAIIVVVNTYFITGYKDYPEVWGQADIESTHIYNSLLQDYSKANGLLYADVYSAQGEANWVVAGDGVHPNNLGHLLIANKVFEVIASNCSCLSVKAYKEAVGYSGWADEHESSLRNYCGI